jgi:hypothetical protein
VLASAQGVPVTLSSHSGGAGPSAVAAALQHMSPHRPLDPAALAGAVARHADPLQIVTTGPGTVATPLLVGATGVVAAAAGSAGPVVVKPVGGGETPIAPHLNSTDLPPIKAASMQLFVPHVCTTEDISSSLWPDEEVQKIAILDIRLANTDRNEENLLVRAYFKDDAELADVEQAEMTDALNFLRKRRERRRAKKEKERDATRHALTGATGAGGSGSVGKDLVALGAQAGHGHGPSHPQHPLHAHHTQYQHHYMQQQQQAQHQHHDAHSDTRSEISDSVTDDTESRAATGDSGLHPEVSKALLQKMRVPTLLRYWEKMLRQRIPDADIDQCKSAAGGCVAISRILEDDTKLRWQRLMQRMLLRNKSGSNSGAVEEGSTSVSSSRGPTSPLLSSQSGHTWLLQQQRLHAAHGPLRSLMASLPHEHAPDFDAFPSLVDAGSVISDQGSCVSAAMASYGYEMQPSNPSVPSTSYLAAFLMQYARNHVHNNGGSSISTLPPGSGQDSSRISSSERLNKKVHVVDSSSDDDEDERNDRFDASLTLETAARTAPGSTKGKEWYKAANSVDFSLYGLNADSIKIASARNAITPMLTSLSAPRGLAGSNASFVLKGRKFSEGEASLESSNSDLVLGSSAASVPPPVSTAPLVMDPLQVPTKNVYIPPHQRIRTPVVAACAAADVPSQTDSSSNSHVPIPSSTSFGSAFDVDRDTAISNSIATGNQGFPPSMTVNTALSQSRVATFRETPLSSPISPQENLVCPPLAASALGGATPGTVSSLPTPTLFGTFAGSRQTSTSDSPSKARSNLLLESLSGTSNGSAFPSPHSSPKAVQSPHDAASPTPPTAETLSTNFTIALAPMNVPLPVASASVPLPAMDSLAPEDASPALPKPVPWRSARLAARIAAESTAPPDLALDKGKSSEEAPTAVQATVSVIADVPPVIPHTTTIAPARALMLSSAAVSAPPPAINSSIMCSTGRAPGAEDGGVDARKLKTAERLELVPIDHGLCLPSINGLNDISVSWVNWKQAKKEVTEANKAYIQELDGRADSLLLHAALGDRIRPSCLLTLRVCTLLLQEGVRRGLTLSEIAGMMSRNIRLGVIDEPRQEEGKRKRSASAGRARAWSSDNDEDEEDERPSALEQAIKKARRLAAKERKIAAAKARAQHNAQLAAAAQANASGAKQNLYYNRLPWNLATKKGLRKKRKAPPQLSLSSPSHFASSATSAAGMGAAAAKTSQPESGSKPETPTRQRSLSHSDAVGSSLLMDSTPAAGGRTRSSTMQPASEEEEDDFNAFPSGASVEEESKDLEAVGPAGSSRPIHKVSIDEAAVPFLAYHESVTKHFMATIQDHIDVVLEKRNAQKSRFSRFPD